MSRYADPLELIWTATAAHLGMRVARSPEVYASWDGAGTLTLSTQEHFDADDSVAQYVLHELCHRLVEGEDAATKPDWGLDNTDARHEAHEHAACRLQAKLTEEHGLRRLLAVTTEHRAYFDALPADPLADGEDPAIALARIGYARASGGPWAEALRRALEATRAVAEATAPFGAGTIFSSQAERAASQGRAETGGAGSAGPGPVSSR